MVKTRVRRLIEGCEAVLLADLSATKAKEWLDGQMARGKLALQTKSHYVRQIWFFGGWLVDTGRLPQTPFKARGSNGQKILEVSNPGRDSADRKLVRRYLSVEEFGKLRAAAEKGRQFQKIKGRDRSIAY